MLDKLVESKDKRQENRKVRRLLMVTSSLTIFGVSFALVFSLFNQTLAMGNESIEISTLIAPTIAEAAPKLPEPKKATTKKPTKASKAVVPTRKQDVLRLDESPTKAPSKVSTTPSTAKARPNSYVKVGLSDSPDNEVFSNKSGPSKTKSVGDNRFSTEGTPVKVPPKKVKKELPKLPPRPKKEVVKPKKKIILTSKVVNGKALRLVKPAFPPPAKAMGLKGKVHIQVLISENGKVLSAKAVKGNKMFHRNAVSAAKRSTFTPTYLSKQKVKVRGVIIYNFN